MKELIELTGPTRRPEERGERAMRELRVCLITSLAIADFIDPELTVEGARRIMPGNVGILTLVSVLRDRGYDPHVVSLDRLFLDFRGSTAQEGSASDSKTQSDADDTFFSYVLRRIESLKYDVFGLGTICSSYPLTIRLAEQLKRLYPQSHILLGGPQATVVDESTLHTFPFVDFVVRGEADSTLPDLLDVISERSQRTFADIPGVTYRCGKRVVRNSNSPVLRDLDTLPLPAFDLDSDIMNRGSIYLEIGRGCPFACTFCSTNDFFRRNFRLKSAQRTIHEMRHVRQAYGVNNFSFVHDMYTVDRKRVVEFCESVLASGEEFTWACSARTDCVDDALIELMARAGCRGIFFGIETGSSRLQKVIKKRLDLVEAKRRIECADRNGIKTAVALITAFPDEQREDLRDTIHYFVDSLRFDHAEPQLSLLAPLGATPIYEQHKHELVLDHIFSDVSHQGWHQDPADVDLIKSHPDIFSNFYAVPTRWLPRKYFKGIRDLVTYLALRFRWLPLGLLQDSGDFLDVFDRWTAWLRDEQEHSKLTQSDDSSVVPYYCSRQFVTDFLRFVSTYYVNEMAGEPEAIAALVAAESATQEVIAQSTEPVGADGAQQLDYTSVPVRSERVRVVSFGVDYRKLLLNLRTVQDLGSVPRREVDVVFQQRDGQVVVTELAGLTADLYRRCDGRRTVQEILYEFSVPFGKGLDIPGVSGVSAEQAALVGLVTLGEEGIVRFASGNVALREQVHVGEIAALPRYSPPPETSDTQRPWPWAPARTSSQG